MTDRSLILQCYYSGQMSAAQWERHCEDDPELRTLVSGDSPSDLPPSLVVKPNLDWSEQTIEQLEAERVYWDERVRTAPGFASANAAVEFRDACDTWINRKRSKECDANAPAISRAEDTSPGVKTGATDPIAAMREALKELVRLKDYKGHFGKNDPYEREKPVAWDNARAALAAYDAAAAPSRQSADVEAMARELALRFRRPFSSEKLIEELLSFTARVAADQREKDAKIAETPDPQRANKTAAQIAAAIRGQGND